MEATELIELFRFLKATPFFKILSDEQLQRIARSVAISYHKNGELVDLEPLETPTLFLVRSGSLNTFSKHNQLVDQAGEHDLFGPESLVSQQIAAHHAVTLEDSLLYRIPLAIFQKLGDTPKAFTEQLYPARQGTLTKGENGALHLNSQIKQLLKKPPVTAQADISIREAAQVMRHNRVSSLLLLQEEKLVGIITDRDLRNRVIAAGLSSNRPVSQTMTKEPVSIDPNAFVFDALLIMSQHNIHHLPVVKNGKVAGVISTTDIIKLQSEQPVYLVGEIWKANSSSELAQTCLSIPALFAQLVEAGSKATMVSRIITAIADAVTQKLLQLAENKLGQPPIPYTWVAFGSQGREELSINSDQDNALLMDNRYDASIHENYFEQLAQFVCDGLNACCYRYCPGKIMATTADWRQPLASWQEQFRKWIEEPTPEATMFCSIFFDLRAISGDQALLETLQASILEMSSNNQLFLALMARNALTHRPPLGFFRAFVLENDGEHQNELNLKHRGLLPITDLARLNALTYKITALNSSERLQALKEEKFHEDDIDNLRDSLELMGKIRFEFQAEDIRKNRTPDNFIDPKKLSSFQRQHLKQAFQIVKQSQEALKNRFPGL